MSRIPTLPGGCKSLSDPVRVIGLDGEMFRLMTLAKAQSLAADQRAELVYLTRGRRECIFRLVDEALKKRIRKGGR